MKYTCLMILLLIALPGLSQESRQKLAANQPVKVQYHKANIAVEGYKGSEVVIQAKRYEAPPERAKGMRSLYNTAVDNTGIGLSVETKDGVMVIREASQKGGEYVIRIPEGTRLSVEQMNWGGGGDINVRGMRDELEVKSLNAKVRLTDVAGPVIANSTSGDIVVSFSELNQKGPSMITSVASDVDVTLPANAKATLTLGSVTGEIYTDLDLQMLNKNNKEAGMNYVGGGNSTIRANLNGGGTPLTIRSTSSDIYIRKR